MLYMADHDGAKIKGEIDNLLKSIANVNMPSSMMEGGRRKRKTKTSSKGRKLQDGGRKRRTKSKSKSKGRKLQDMDMEGGRRKRKTMSKGKKSKSGSKGRKMKREMNPKIADDMEGGRRKRKTMSKGKKSKSGSKGRKMKREMNPKFADVIKFQAHVRKDSGLKGGKAMTKVAWKWYKANGESYEKTVAAYNKDKSGFAKEMQQVA